MMRTYKISWLLYIIGSLLVFGSWINLVPVWLGWVGWLAALAGWGMSTSAKQQSPRQNSRMDELAKLNLLHKEGVVSAEEFEKEKDAFCGNSECETKSVVRRGLCG